MSVPLEPVMESAELVPFRVSFPDVPVIFATLCLPWVRPGLSPGSEVHTFDNASKMWPELGGFDDGTGGIVARLWQSPLNSGLGRPARPHRPAAPEKLPQPRAPAPGPMGSSRSS